MLFMSSIISGGLCTLGSLQIYQPPFTDVGLSAMLKAILEQQFLGPAFIEISETC